MTNSLPDAVERSINLVAKNAGKPWNDDAVAAVCRYIEDHEQFLTENIREVAEPVIGAPHDSRAWGAIMKRAARARLIEKIGYAPAISSHGSPKPLWRRVPPHQRNLS